MILGLALVLCLAVSEIIVRTFHQDELSHFNKLKIGMLIEEEQLSDIDLIAYLDFVKRLCSFYRAVS